MYRDNIKHAKLFSEHQKGTETIPYIEGGDAFQHIRRDVFFARAYRTYPKERIWTIRDVMERWGVLNHYDELIRQMERRTDRTGRTGSNEIAIVEWNDSDLTSNFDEQRILNWGLYDEITGKCYVYGGVVFQQGKMTFHT